MDREALAAAVKAEQQERAQACVVELKELLERHGCELAGVPGLTADGRIVAEVIVRAR